MGLSASDTNMHRYYLFVICSFIFASFAFMSLSNMGGSRGIGSRHLSWAALFTCRRGKNGEGRSSQEGGNEPTQFFYRNECCYKENQYKKIDTSRHNKEQTEQQD
jgi:hypothetical protein